MEEAVRRAGRGDAEAFETLVQPELADIRRLATAVVLDREVADDVIQDSLVAAWRGIGGLRDPASFRTWLRRIVINRARNALRRPRTLRLVDGVRPVDPQNRSDPSGEWTDAIALETAMRELNPDHALEAGRYLFGERPTADLRIGEEVVLFLRYGGNGGLYGDRYGVVRTLSPAHPLYYAFRVDGEGTKNLSEGGPAGDQWNASLDELRDIAASLAPQPDLPSPDARVYPAKPTHDASEQPLPSPTPCPPIRVQGYWAGYSTLDALLEETDLVVVARPTTRAREVTAQADDALVVLANDVLVEQVLAGDTTAGSLLPVERLAHRDPACPLIIDGNEPLQIDRPYVMALRRGSSGFVLPEAPRALAEIRDGRLASSRWPELDGLTIEAARARLTISGGVDRLKADLEAARATIVELGTFNGPPFAGSDVRLCVGGQAGRRIHLRQCREPRRGRRGLIDPDDPSHLGLDIVEWQGGPRFWQRDRIIVFHQGTDEATERLLTAVLGQPFAQSRVGDPRAFNAS